MHDVKLWTVRQSGESRALRSVLRNHAEGYALLCTGTSGCTIVAVVVLG